MPPSDLQESEIKLGKPLLQTPISHASRFIPTAIIAEEAFFATGGVWKLASQPALRDRVSQTTSTSGGLQESGGCRGEGVCGEPAATVTSRRNNTALVCIS
ncbi:uncharacterized protein VTP21DRAFT_2654 [Calcarisporiella thermophila]|uniref:uncharacterized protein n=1 Tax=Calcarisporiella thermophila TaxID=911321 RepID=UPI003742ACDD